MRVKDREHGGISTADLAAADAPRDQPPPQQGPSPRDPEGLAPLIPPDAAQEFRSRWDHVQGQFVDEPRRSVEEADQLVAQLIKKIAQTFADERARLEEQWTKGSNVSTEDLRLALRKYRSFFERFLNL
jgi:hypothetical protein